MTVQELNQSLQETLTTSDAIKDKIEDVAENKGISVDYGTDTPLTLLTKIDNGTVPSGESIITELNLPSALQNATTYYTFNLADKNVLVSSSNTDCGVWLYKYSNKTLTQLVSTGNAQYFQEVEDGYCLLSGSSSLGGIWLYSPSTQNITQIYNNAYSWGRYVEIEGYWLIGCTSSSPGVSTGLVGYDPTTRAAVSLTSSLGALGYGIYNVIHITEIDKYIISADQYSTWLFHPLTKVITRAGVGMSSQNNYIYLGNNKCLFTGTDTFTTGIYVFDTQTELLENKTSSTSYGWTIYAQAGTQGFISGTPGTCVYDSADDTLTVLDGTWHSSGDKWTYFNVFNDLVLISGNQSRIAGIYVYDTNTKTWSKDFANGYNWTNPIIVNNNKTIYLFANSSVGAGVLRYDYDTKEFTQLTGSDYNSLYFTSDYVLETTSYYLVSCSGTSLNGLYSIAKSDGTLTKLNSSGNRYLYIFSVDSSTYLLMNLYSSGIFKFNDSANTVTTISSDARGTSTFGFYDMGDSTNVLVPGSNGAYLFNYLTDASTLITSLGSGNGRINPYKDGYICGNYQLCYIQKITGNIYTSSNTNNPTKNYEIFYQNADFCLLRPSTTDTSSAAAVSKGLVKFDYDTKTFTYFSQGGHSWDMWGDNIAYSEVAALNCNTDSSLGPMLVSSMENLQGVTSSSSYTYTYLRYHSLFYNYYSIGVAGVLDLLNSQSYNVGLKYNNLTNIVNNQISSVSTSADKILVIDLSRGV